MADKSEIGPKVLIISNQKENVFFRDFNLPQQDVDVVIETDPTRTFERFEIEVPDLLILDLELGERDIVALIETLRPQMYIPILLLTRNGAESFILESYTAGADDCIVKPVSLELLQTKVRVWVRRSWSAGPGMYGSMKAGGMELFPAEKVFVLDDNQQVRLTNLELRLLYSLMQQVGHVITIEELTEKIWGYSGESDNTLVKNVVYRLRRKIESDPAKPNIIQTVPGVGYRLTVE